MAGEVIEAGMRVRYTGTGTTGTVTRFERQEGKEYAELDTTHLLYRTDKLVPVEAGIEKKRHTPEDIKKTIEEEREFISGSAFQESLKNIDQSCEGGG
ncbi:MAG: DUF2098 family protein [Methanomicrobiales archaeon]